jgi:hypothetical protein
MPASCHAGGCKVEFIEESGESPRDGSGGCIVKPGSCTDGLKKGEVEL